MLNLESTAIKYYLMTHNTNHIPVDTLERPKGYDDDVNFLHDRIFNNITMPECRALKNLVHRNLKNVYSYGFNFLNSSYNNDYIKEVDTLIKEIVYKLNDERMLRIYNTDVEIKLRREDEMLRNIRAYTDKNNYINGLFFIGSGHRESIMNKIMVDHYLMQNQIKWLIFRPETGSFCPIK